jgi:hypothetical protein
LVYFLSSAGICVLGRLFSYPFDRSSSMAYDLREIPEAGETTPMAAKVYLCPLSRYSVRKRFALLITKSPPGNSLGKILWGDVDKPASGRDVETGFLAERYYEVLISFFSLCCFHVGFARYYN